ncbi:protein of unknown function [Pararobbsia alpina]
MTAGVTLLRGGRLPLLFDSSNPKGKHKIFVAYAVENEAGLVDLGWASVRQKSSARSN